MPKKPPTPTEESPPQGNAIGCLARIFWIAGILPLVIFAVEIGYKRQARLTLIDLFFWLLAFAMIAVRYADVRWFAGTTTDGKPATMATWRRYALLIGALTLGMWGAAQGIAFMFPK
ncbi:MAG TPA: hypothetical protein PKW95_17095 [bacterium]|nr:hypothetical protein [bacterium]